MHILQIGIGPIIRIGRESWCLPYAGFLYYINIKTLIGFWDSTGIIIRQV